ncbi:MAG TPA: VCBS repeat-containing protein [Segetibacter sp.]|nr:VCBS repeat-containing protein [Segetibacter sp.]
MLTLISILNLLFHFGRTTQPPFKPQTLDSSIAIGYGIALGDVDGDGKPDILLADKKQFAWYRNGDWKKFVMIENLTEHDNVCIAARDIDGDGKVEVAVGAQWNPSETANAEQSGSVHYLIPPANPTGLWKAVELHHEPTVHRMKWLKAAGGKFYLVVVPLHGRGNVSGEGEGAKVIAYEFPKDVNGQWPMYTLVNDMHLTHNFHLVESTDKNGNGFYLAGKEGIRFIAENFRTGAEGKSRQLPGLTYGAGEVRMGKSASNKRFIATIEPMHGDKVVVYPQDDATKRIVLDDNIKEGHALAAADFIGTGSDQVVAGWRTPNKDSSIGIKLYTKTDPSGTQWQSQWIDKNGMACEDLQVMDLNKDGKPDIVASGRSTHNLKIYWNVAGK